MFIEKHKMILFCPQTQAENIEYIHLQDVVVLVILNIVLRFTDVVFHNSRCSGSIQRLLVLYSLNNPFSLLVSSSYFSLPPFLSLFLPEIALLPSIQLHICTRITTDFYSPAPPRGQVKTVILQSILEAELIPCGPKPLS